MTNSYPSAPHLVILETLASTQTYTSSYFLETFNFFLLSASLSFRNTLLVVTDDICSKMAPTEALDDRNGDIESRPEEETPLLSHDLPPTVAPSRRYQLKVIGLAMTFILIVEVGAYLQIPPSYQLMEEIICRQRYPDHIISAEDDDVCKGPDVQGQLAMIKGWQNSFDCVPCMSHPQTPTVSAG